MPPRKQHVALLLAKAAQDEYVLDKLLDDSDAPVEIFGFHAQQTAEKLLKAILCHAGIEYPLTHQLVELLDLARCPAGRRTAGIGQSSRATGIATGGLERDLRTGVSHRHRRLADVTWVQGGKIRVTGEISGVQSQNMR